MASLDAQDHRFVAWWSLKAPLVMQSQQLTKAALPTYLGLSAGSASAFIDTNSPHTVGVFDFNAKTFTRPTNLSPAEGARAVKDGALVLDTAPPYGLWLVRDDASYLKLVIPTLNKIVPSVALDRSAGEQIVWTEGDDIGMLYTNVSIWTSPYASTPGGIQKTKLANLTDPENHGGTGMVANAGVVLNRVGKNKALITRLSDGWGWTFDAESGQDFQSPYWVDTDYVYMVTRPDLPDGYAAGILRMARSVLGSPTVPPF
jgi:hypothetical protein